MVRRRGDQVVHDRDAVERDAVLNFARASADEVLTRWGSVGTLLPGEHTGSSNGKLQGIATVERKIGD